MEGRPEIVGKEDEWIVEQEVERLTSIPLQTLRNRRFQRKGFPYYKIGRSIRYKKSEVLAMMEASRVEVRR